MVSSRAEGRLEPHPTQLIDRSKMVEFEFNGRRIAAYDGDTIATALYAAGVRIFTRSFKYHRPRGLLCAAGRCPNCLMTVDGTPNVASCAVPVAAGMVVRQQNAWPSVEHDLLAVLDRLDRVLPVGFYYKALHTPKIAWRIAGPIIRRVAGLGAVDQGAARDHRYGHETRHVDVAVVGGGASGMSAALAAAGGGRRVALIDDQTSLGGRSRFDANSYSDLPGIGAAIGYEAADALAERVRSDNGIEVLAPATAFGLYEGNLLGVLCDDRMVRLRARYLVVAAGAYEQPMTFDRNDLPGVMLGTAVQRLVHLYGIAPGTAAMVATCDNQGYYAALDMLRAGIRIVAVVDARPDFPQELNVARELQSQGVVVLNSHAPIRAEGTKKVVGAAVSRLVDGKTTTEEREFDCDLIAMSGGHQPADSLLLQAGSTAEYDPALDRMVVAELPANLSAAGRVTGTDDLRLSMLQGREAGLDAAAAKGSGGRDELAEAQVAYGREVKVAPAPVDLGQGAKQFVCYCEDVTARDVAYAVDEGFEDIETLKRYTTVTMGPCQGKMCQKAFAGICSALTGRTIAETGTTTARPPVRPVPLGALAGPSHMPIKRTAIDRRHRELGAQMMELGPWQRPYSYGSPQEECLAVRERVGIIDVGTLGKLDVRGRDAPALLDKVYTHYLSNLRVGRIRYGILCFENGTVLDDGTVTRLADDRYFVTTTTGNIDLIEEWFKWWMAGTGMCAHVANVTGAYAAINVAGPRARDTLAKLTEVDLSPQAFRYMRSAQGDVAGVPAIFLRIGFVGETGWELHFPAEYGEYMWDALMDAGQEYGIAPFGVEAQRILRLEKKHVIINQDTDAVSNPIEGDMGWAVKFDKEDFIGRAALAAVRDSGARERLVGFEMRDGGVPDDGAPVVSGFAPVGRVTSSRRSPTTGRGFGLVWLPAEMAEEGRVIHIRVDGRIMPADVTFQPLYDPDGKRLRE